MSLSISIFKWLLILIVSYAISSFSFANQAQTKSAQQLNEAAYENFQQGNYETAYKLSNQALAQANSENNASEKARAFNNLASNLLYFGDSERALELYTQSLNQSLAAKDLSGVNRAYNNLANVYTDIGDIDEATKFRYLQLENSLQTGDSLDQVSAYIGLAQIMTDKNNIESAKTYIEQAWQAHAEQQDPFLEVYILTTAAMVAEKEQNYAEAVTANKKAVAIAQQNDFHGLVISSKVNVARSYLKQKRFQEAIDLSKELLPESLRFKLSFKNIQLYKILNQAYESLGNFEQALSYQRKIEELEQEFVGEKIKFLGEVFKLDRQFMEQQEKLEELQKDQQIMSLKMEQQKQNQIIWISLSLLLIAIVSFVYYRYMSRKELQRQKLVNQRLQELDRVKDRVLTNTSHELRTPLNGIIGLSEIIIQDENNNFSEANLNCLKLIKSSGEQLARVVNDILELSKLRNSQLTVFKTDFNIVELIEDVVNVCQPNIKSKSVELINQNRGQSILVKQDRGRLQQVLFNVIGNAIKFTNQGFVHITSELKDNQLTISCTDTGIGIPAEKQARVFEGFEQVDDGDSRAKSGTGLGLAITKGIVEALDGRIELYSELGKGTKIKVILPNVNTTNSSS